MRYEEPKMEIVILDEKNLVTTTSTLGVVNSGEAQEITDSGLGLEQ